MILKTPAIVLRMHPFTETSRVVTWLTPANGRINTLLKGALRPKSAFLGQVDLFYTCELLYYAKLTDGLPIARECTALNARTALREDWRACAVASYLCSLLARAIPEKASRQDIFDWLNAALDDAAIHGGSIPVLCWQELHLLKTLGLAPRLATCRECGGGPDEPNVPFSIAEGSWRCSRCRAGTATPNAIGIAASLLEKLSGWMSVSSPMVARTTRLSFEQRTALGRFAGLFLAHHLDISPAPRAAALDILSRRPPRPVDQNVALR
ncbi:MAG: DNA repair protein RecO [Kiritimatiellae bacterium]|nr:DNA repair protein RecO [Kiritimatiellia bacterium]